MIKSLAVDVLWIALAVIAVSIAWSVIVGLVMVTIERRKGK